MTATLDASLLPGGGPASEAGPWMARAALLSMANFGSHAPLFLTQFAAALACFLDAHQSLQKSSANCR
jgi:hypothetical protein